MGRDTQTGPDHRFTEAELDIARGTDLPDLLSSLGYHVRRVGSYYTAKEMDSLRIRDRRTWFRYSELRGGDAISFLQRFRGMGFTEAVDYLLAWHGQARDSPSRLPESPLPPRAKERASFSLPPPHTDSRRVFAYLRGRGIAPQVIRDFIGSGLLYEDAKYHNCVFVGKDGGGKPVFAAKRGTYSMGGAGFKGDEAGSDKDTAFRLPCGRDKLRVFVFEAPIDLMSYCTLHREVRGNAVALCGLYDGPLDTYLRENPHLRHIDLCLDADGPGREAAGKMAEKYTQKGYTVSVHAPPKGKDWNEFLVHRQKSREKER